MKRVFALTILVTLLLSCHEADNAKKITEAIKSDNYDTIYLKPIDSVTLKFIENGKETLVHADRGFFQQYTMFRLYPIADSSKKITLLIKPIGEYEFLTQVFRNGDSLFWQSENSNSTKVLMLNR
ncbi:MAG: hypothetical protein JNL23_06640 [Chitinophagaceae bacterium]|nr:hypothetical protein [Chitinophagaceae bacterium]